MVFQKENRFWQLAKHNKPITKPRKIIRKCICGCGQKALMSRYSKGYIKGHWLKGKPNPLKAGKNSPFWKGGIIEKRGYVFIYTPRHPHKTEGPYVKRSRLIMEKKLGRYLKSTEIVHHINGIRNDDRPENLIITTRSSHTAIHHTTKELKACKKCHKKSKDCVRGLCPKCYQSWYYYNITKFKKRPKRRYFRNIKRI